MPLIILEGPDCSGKSTLGEKISARLGIPLDHDGGPSKDEAQCRERICHAMLLDSGLRDRSTLFSDSIYKRSLNLGKPYVSDDEIDSYVKNFASRGDVLVIYARPPMDVILNNVDALLRDKPHKPPEYADKVRRDLPAIVREYDRCMRRWIALGLPVMRVDWTTEKTEDVLQAIELFWSSRNGAKL